MALIGIMDSGLGGLSAMREIVKVLPSADYIYYADSAHCPYGEKSPEYIIGRCKTICGMMIERGADAVVIACNTATTTAIASLRATYDIPFIGMEPAVKPAVKLTRSGVIGVLATAGTLKGGKYSVSKQRYGSQVRIVESIGAGFVELVERGETSGPHAREVVLASLKPLLDAGADTIVLGCTHYPFLLDTMKEIAPSGTLFIDPAPAVAAHLVDVLRERGILPDAHDTAVVGTPVGTAAPDTHGIAPVGTAAPDAHDIAPAGTAASDAHGIAHAGTHVGTREFLSSGDPSPLLRMAQALRLRSE